MLAECQTAEEVRAHYKAVRARTRQWQAPPKVARQIEIVEPVVESIPVVVTTTVAVHQQEPEPIVVYKHPSIYRIIGVVGVVFGQSRTDLVSARRTGKLARARQVVMYLARELTLRSLPQIGLQLGGRDHSTILHGVRKIARLRKTDEEFDAQITQIITVLRANVEAA